MNSQENRDRLAREVKVARLRKYKTVDRARIAAGVSRGTWDSVERGDSVKDFSLASIEEALDWPAGYALSILEGQEGKQLRGPGRVAELIEAFAAENPHVTNAALAAKVGISQSALRLWRTQAMTDPPEAASIRRLAAALGLDLKEVFFAFGIDAGLVIETVVTDDELIRRRIAEVRASAQQIPDADTGSA